MKVRNLILVGVLSCVVFAFVLFPASLLWRLVSGSVTGLPVQVERVGGTIWDGFAYGRLRTSYVNGPVVIGWDLRGLRLLLVRLEPARPAARHQTACAATRCNPTASAEPPASNGVGGMRRSLLNLASEGKVMQSAHEDTSS